MTTYYIEENLLSARVRAFVKDEEDRPVFLLVGSWGVKGDCLSINDLDDKRLAKVVQTSYSPNPKFDLYDEEKKVGSLRRVFSLKRDRYWVSKLKWLATGENRYKRYKISYLGKDVCTAGLIRKDNKTYFKIIIPNEEDASIAICVLAILDYWVRKHVKLEELSLNNPILLQPLMNKCKNLKD